MIQKDNPEAGSIAALNCSFKPFGPFDAAGNAALEMQKVLGFNKGKRDFALGKVEKPEIRIRADGTRSKMDQARMDGYIDGWMTAQVAHYKRLLDASEPRTERS
jgi:hypothetical protein